MSDASGADPRPPRLRADPARMRGFLRQDGRKGVRNFVVVAYLVECAHHVARKIAEPFQDRGAQLIGFPGCYPSAYAHRVLEALCTHPNVGAVLLVSLGCEEFRRSALRDAVLASGRPVELLVIQEEGGTTSTVAAGRAWVEARLAEAASRSDRAARFLAISSSARNAAAPTGSAASPPTRPSAPPSTGSSTPARR